jgi:hypothetical protein
MIVAHSTGIRAVRIMRARPDHPTTSDTGFAVADIAARRA